MNSFQRAKSACVTTFRIGPKFEKYLFNALDAVYNLFIHHYGG